MFYKARDKHRPRALIHTSKWRSVYKHIDFKTTKRNSRVTESSASEIFTQPQINRSQLCSNALRTFLVEDRKQKRIYTF